jgi:hypothetical protein
VIGEAGGAPEILFLGSGQSVAFGKWSITPEKADVQASLSRHVNTDGTPGNAYELSASGAITLTMPVTGSRRPEVTKAGSPAEKLQGSINGDVFTVQIPSGKYLINNL